MLWHPCNGRVAIAEEDDEMSQHHHKRLWKLELLEKHGADVEAKNSDGKGVVDRALDFFEEDNEDMITLLKQRGLIPEDFERTVQEMAEQLQLHGIKIMSDENMAEEDENEEAN